MISINNKEWEYLNEEDVKKAIIEGDESFFFEFKDDRVDAKKIAAEISALANTYISDLSAVLVTFHHEYLS